MKFNKRVSSNILISLITSVLLYAVVIYILFDINNEDLDKLVKVYSESIRGYIFTAFLAVASFLLSLLTFVVINLKEKMFDTKEYIDIAKKSWEKRRKESTFKKKNLYEPLVVISWVLAFAISSCFLTSISQFLFGFSSNHYVLLLPTYLPFLSLTLLIITLYQMVDLILQWLSSDEDLDV
ncbi:hypothetical protein [Morganella morganii]|uniref:hypothetical protein n=1 Tax=Morganella morganii TaxID=582 RepID=UPI000F718DA4|nr:MAG: hypothetical protein [Phage NG54]EKV4236471.1 hypothetical protein [Morganella morganii]ELL8928676.1 hypothetical protein [Morganella morganii]